MDINIPVSFVLQLLIVLNSFDLSISCLLHFKKCPILQWSKEQTALTERKANHTITTWFLSSCLGKIQNRKLRTEPGGLELPEPSLWGQDYGSSYPPPVYHKDKNTLNTNDTFKRNSKSGMYV